MFVRLDCAMTQGLQVLVCATSDVSRGGGGAPSASANPMDQNFLNFMQFFGIFGKNHMLALPPPREILDPPLATNTKYHRHAFLLACDDTQIYIHCYISFIMYLVYSQPTSSFQRHLHTEISVWNSV